MAVRARHQAAVTDRDSIDREMGSRGMAGVYLAHESRFQALLDRLSLPG